MREFLSPKFPQPHMRQIGEKMKNYFKKSVGVLLILLTLISTLTGCYQNEEYHRGDTYISLRPNYSQECYARVEADKSIFDIDDVTLDFSYGFYSLDGNRTLETARIHNLYNENGVVIENNFAIYISNSEDLVFERDDNRKIVDYDNKVNAKLWKFISFEEAFNTDYGYTISEFEINYNHSEKITLPIEFFAAQSGTVFIHVVCLRYLVNDQLFALGDDKTMIELEYRLIGDKLVLR